MREAATMVVMVIIALATRSSGGHCGRDHITLRIESY